MGVSLSGGCLLTTRGSRGSPGEASAAERRMQSEDGEDAWSFCSWQQFPKTVLAVGGCEQMQAEVVARWQLCDPCSLR